MLSLSIQKNNMNWTFHCLQDYFSKEPWYKPAASNDNIKLSFIEQLNMELIKAEEENPDHESYVKE